MLLLYGLIALLALPSGFCLFDDSDSSEELRQKRNFVFGSRKDYSSLYYRQDSYKHEGEGEERFYTYKSVCFIDNRVQLFDGFDCRNQIAVGRFRNAINSTGWSYLEIETKQGFDADLQAYAAGVLEGVLSQKIIDYALQNTYYDYCKGYQRYCAKLNKYLNDNLLYIKKKIENAPKDDPYWQSVRRSFLQLTGVLDGFKNNTSFEKIEINYEIHPIMMININGELYDLDKKFNKTKDPVNSEEGSKCSGLIKVTPNNADLLISQVTMSGFQNLLRVLKLYKFGYDQRMFPGHTTTFASYPGMLYSSDDFALLSSGLYHPIIVRILKLIQEMPQKRPIERDINGDEGMHSGAKMPNLDLQDQIDKLSSVVNVLAPVVHRLDADNSKEFLMIYNVDFALTNNRKDNRKLLLNGVFELLDHILDKNYSSTAVGSPEYLGKTEKKFIKVKLGSLLVNNVMDSLHRLKTFKPKLFKVNGRIDVQRCLSNSSMKKRKIGLIIKQELIAMFKDMLHQKKINAVPFVLLKGNTIKVGADEPKTFDIVKDLIGTNYQLFKQLRFRALSSPAYDNVPPFQWSKCDLANTVKHVGHPDLWNFESIQTSWETPNINVEL